MARPATSTWRYIATAVALLVGVVLIGVVTNDDPPAAVPSPTQPVASTTTTTVAPTTTVVIVTSTVLPVPEPDVTGVDREPVLAATRVFVVGWLAQAPKEERAKWLEPVTAPALAPVVADIPLDALPQGVAGDIEVVYADEYRAVVHVPVPDAGVTAKITLLATAAPGLPETGGWRVSALDKA